MKSIFVSTVALGAAVAVGDVAQPSVVELSGCEKGRLVEISDVAYARFDALFARRIKEIDNTPNCAVPKDAPRRYLSARGDDAADGLTPRTAWRTVQRQ